MLDIGQTQYGIKNPLFVLSLYIEMHAFTVVQRYSKALLHSVMVIGVKKMNHSNQNKQFRIANISLTPRIFAREINTLY